MSEVVEAATNRNDNAPTIHDISTPPIADPMQQPTHDPWGARGQKPVRQPENNLLDLEVQPSVHAVQNSPFDGRAVAGQYPSARLPAAVAPGTRCTPVTDGLTYGPRALFSDRTCRPCPGCSASDTLHGHADSSRPSPFPITDRSPWTKAKPHAVPGHALWGALGSASSRRG